MRQVTAFSFLVLLAACGSDETETPSTTSTPEHHAGTETPPDHTKMTHEDAGEHDKAARYACPMHPEVTSNEAGSCPECGMDLVEMDHKMEDAHDQGDGPHDDHGDHDHH